MTIVKAAQKGYREGLEAMRDKLAAAMEVAEPAVVAQIAGRLQAVLKELASLSTGHEETVDDVLAQRRAARESKAGASAAAKPSRKRRSR